MTSPISSHPVPPFQNERHNNIGGLLREAVFGFNDGLVSTIALIAGLSGAVLDHSIVLLASVAEVFAGALSMGLGTYLGNKSERDVYQGELEREKWEIAHMPEIEREEIREIYRRRGFKGELLEKVTDVITSDKKVWIDVMMQDELGFAKRESMYHPVSHAFSMGIAFVVGSLFPLFPYLFQETPRTFTFALMISGVALLVAGTVKTYFTRRPIWKSSLETFFIGAAAAAASYGIGVLLGG